MNDLREYAIQGGKKLKVEVNQRLLIDKMLARYCSQFVVFRECLQNADDAGAQTCTLEFKTADSTVQEIAIVNNGRVFQEKDWVRLTRIAEGNPDENTVGMFGVGFYSVFSLCEEPIVISGSQCLVFTWDGCQLVTYSKKLPANKCGTTTSVVMKVRERLELSSAKKKVPTLNLDDLKGFLAQVVCFTKTICDISLTINGFCKFRISKKCSPIPVKEKQYFPKRGDKIFELVDLKKNLQSMSVEEFCLEDKVSSKCHILTLNHFEATFRTHLEADYHEKVQRITKKPLPAKATVQLLFPNDQKEDSNPGPHLQGIVPFTNIPLGRIFVGLATHQTTGTGWHVHASLIPTIERENIDFQDAYLKIWNSDLLFSAGEVGRTIYDIEMNSASKSKTKSLDEKLVCSNAFLPSHPSKEVGDLLASGFFHSDRQLLVPCSDTGLLGLHASEDCFLPFQGIEAFAAYPVVPTEVISQAPRFFDELLKRGRISQLSLEQARQSVKENVLTDQQFTAFLNWLCRGQTLKQERTKLTSEVKFLVSNQVCQFKDIKYFNVATTFSIPLPISVLPESFTKGLSSNQMSSCLGLKLLSFSQWLEFILDASEKLESPQESPSILAHLSRNCGEMSSKEWKQVIRVLGNSSCIPSTHGMKPPRDVYFPSAALPLNLPQVKDLIIRDEDDELNSDAMNVVTHSFLKRLGVRYSSVNVLVESQQKAAIDPKSRKNLSMDKLVSQLMSQRKEMSELDYQELSHKKFLSGCCLGEFSKTSKSLYSPNELHFPQVAIALEDPTLLVVQWDGLTIDSDEGQFLVKLGVREVPVLAHMLSLCALPSMTALEFFVSHLKRCYPDYKPTKVSETFIPCVPALDFAEASDAKHAGVMCSPSTCFLAPNPLFPVVTPEFQQLCAKYDADLGVKAAPNLELGLSALESRPLNVVSSRAVFEYLCDNAEGFKADLINKIAKMSFIPCKDRLCKPIEVFLRSADVEGEEENEPVVPLGKRKRTSARSTRQQGVEAGELGVKNASLDGFLDYVDFGPKANQFLALCGVKTEATPTQFASLIIARSQEFFAAANPNRIERYKTVILQLARVISKVDKATKQLLKTSPWALAFRKTNAKEEAECNLVVPSSCYLVDNARFEYLLRPWCVPDDRELQPLYLACGSSWLTSNVTKTKRPVGGATETPHTKNLQNLIVDRLPLLCFNNRAEKRPGLCNKASTLLASLSVKQVASLEMTLTFEKKSFPIKHDNCSSCVLDIKGNRATLFVVQPEKEIVWYDIAEELGFVLFPGGHEYTHYFTVVLSSTLDVLKRQGLPVERLLKQDTQPEYKFAPGPPEEVANTTKRHRVDLGDRVEDFTQSAKKTQQDVLSVLKRGQTFRGTSLNEQEHVQERIDHQCEAIPNQTMAKESQTFNGMPLFFDIKVGAGLRASCLQGANAFSLLLLKLANVLSAKPKAFHMFADQDGSRIAFNKDGALFFNLRYFTQCHLSDTTSEDPNYFWYMVACHELAHNGESGHNARHEHLLEGLAVARFTSFLQQFGGK